MLFPVGDTPQVLSVDRLAPDREIRNAVQGEFDVLSATSGDFKLYVNSSAADNSLPNRIINPENFTDGEGLLSDKSLIAGMCDGQPFSFVFGDVVALACNESGELVDMPPALKTELKENLTDPLEDYDMKFREAFGRYQNWDLSQAEAAQLAGVSQQTFSYHANKITNAHSTRGRGLKPLPKGFDRLYDMYKSGAISARSAATELGISHPTFLKYAKEQDLRLHKDDLVQSRTHRGLAERRGSITSASKNLNGKRDPLDFRAPER